MMLASKTEVDISIIITAHAEGRLSHKTLMSVLRAAVKLEDNNISYEIIISMDNPSQDTESYYQQYARDDRFNILVGSYGNVADSRNNAVKQSRGIYIALLDGDDMISSNWYLDSYNLARLKKGLFVLHPNVQLQFGIDEDRELVWVMADSYDRDKDAMIMVQFNRWVSALFAPRAVFDNIHYKQPRNGYGYEDFCFNADTIAAGIKHYVTPQTTFFYRRSINGKQNEHISQHTVLPYTPLFDIDYAKTWKMPEGSRAASLGLRTIPRRIVTKAYNLAKSSSLVRRVVGNQTKLIHDILYRRKLSGIPNWLIEQWREINSIDNQLWPTDNSVRRLQYHPRSFDQDGVDATRVGCCYAQLAKQFTKKPDYIFFTYDPLGAGGTEKVLINYIKSLKKSHPDWHFAIMRKKPDNFPFEVPDGVDFIDFFGMTDGMHPWERNVLFDRLIIQSQSKRLHFFFNGWANGDYAYNWVREHKNFLKKNDYHIYVSWFMQEFVPNDEHGRVMTFADPYLGEIYDCVEAIFTDNQTIIDRSLENNYFDRNKFKVHYQPMDDSAFAKPHKISHRRPLKVLWASRLSYQKRPDILKSIAVRLNPSEIRIDAYGREQNYRGSYLNGISSLTYKGEFKGLSSLALDDYDVFLYTSQVDGMPNVLLEATAAGLPIVASNDGGVCELIVDNKSGKLVDIDDIDGYVAALSDLANHPELAKRFVGEAQKIVKSRHTWQEFNSSVSKDID